MVKSFNYTYNRNPKGGSFGFLLDFKTLFAKLFVTILVNETLIFFEASEINLNEEAVNHKIITKVVLHDAINVDGKGKEQMRHRKNIRWILDNETRYTIYIRTVYFIITIYTKYKKIRSTINT